MALAVCLCETWEVQRQAAAFYVTVVPAALMAASVVPVVVAAQ